MKKSFRILAGILAAVLLVLPLSGCGSDKDGQESETPSANGDEMVWAPNFESLPKEVGNFECAAFSGDSIYVASTGVEIETHEDADPLGGGSSTTLSSSEDVPVSIYKASIDGQSCEPLPDYVQMALPEGSEGTVNIDGLCADPEGNIWVYEDAYTYHYDLPDGFSGTDADKEQYYVDDGQKYLIRKLSATGEELVSLDLSEITADQDYFYLSSMVCDKDGNVYITANNTTLYVFGKSGEQIFSLEAPQYLFSAVTLSDGSVAAQSYGQVGYEMLAVDVQTKSWGTSIAITSPDNIYSGGGDYSFFYTLSSALYGYNTETDEMEKLFGWLDCDMDQGAVKDMIWREDGSIACVSSADGEGEIAVLSKQKASAATQKTILTLATLSLDSGLRKQILKFNKTSDAYRIEVKDYSEFATDGDYTAALDKMSTEIIAGNVPDIIDITQMPVGQYISRGLLEDLYPYIDADEELSRDSFLPSILKALEVEGGLYQATPGFAIFTVIGKADQVGSDMGWTMDDMLECLAEQPEGTELFQQGITQDTMIEIISYMYMSDFVNWQTGECNFDSQEFIKLLDFCKMFDKEFDYSEDTYESEISRIQSGKQILEITTETDFESFQMYEAMFGGEIVYKGFPREDGIGNVAYVTSGLAMSTTCKDKEGAWSFIRKLLTEEYQSGGDLWTFPTNQASFDKALAEAMEKEMTTDENGNEVEVAKGTWGWDDLMVDMYAVTEEQAARIKALIDSVDGVLTFDTNISDIIKDEAAAYFAGDKTAEDTARLIQSRVSLYVSEQG